jgi:CBS domain-containing protein
MNEYLPLILSILASIFLLAVIIQIKVRRPNWLDIETKWLAISTFPILIGLFAGGYITSFKGLGIEIEASLQKPVSKIVTLAAKEVKVATAIVGENSGLKNSVEHLSNLSEKEKNSIERLIFTNKSSSYSADGVVTYISSLPKLEYIELRDLESKFIGVMLASDLSGNENKFVTSLKSGNVLVVFGKHIVTKYVDKDTSAIDTLDRMRRNNENFLPLLDRDNTMKGIITESSLEKSIATEVLNANKKT